MNWRRQGQWNTLQHSVCMLHFVQAKFVSCVLWNYIYIYIYIFALIILSRIVFEQIIIDYTINNIYVTILCYQNKVQLLSVTSLCVRGKAPAECVIIFWGVFLGAILSIWECDKLQKIIAAEKFGRVSAHPEQQAPLAPKIQMSPNSRFERKMALLANVVPDIFLLCSLKIS